MQSQPSRGPLTGLRILELTGIGPGPFCGMMLADMGAEVICIDRVGHCGDESRATDILFRGKRSIALDLKKPRGAELFLRLCQNADAVFEGFRPGVVERLGIGPEQCLQANSKLVYGRMSGWGQTGPLAQSAGHDINYISLSGALHAMGPAGQPPPPPLNLVGDYGGGGMLLAYGLMCALFEAQRSGQGQVIDCAMTDGAALLMSMFYAMKHAGAFSDRRHSNMLDGGAPYYNCFETADSRYISIGSIEPQFYRLLLQKLGLETPDWLEHQNDPAHWPRMHTELTELFKRKTRDEWCTLLEGTDACFAPVLSLSEAPDHPHNRARRTFGEYFGVTQPEPAPRFNRTPALTPRAPNPVGTDTRSLLEQAGLAAEEIGQLIASGIAGSPA